MILTLQAAIENFIDPTGIGVVGILVYLILTTVFKFISDGKAHRKTNGSSNGGPLNSDVAKYQINEIHKDQQEIKRAVNQIASNGETMTQILQKLEEKIP